jgi:methionyl aminopeptidase
MTTSKTKKVKITDTKFGITIKSKREIDLMRQSGSILARSLETLVEAIRPGMTTKECDKIAEQAIRSQGAKPAFKGYRGFPASLCISVNDEIVHGIPGDRILVDGDIVSVDLGAIVKGYYSDSALTIPIGTIGATGQKLIEVGAEALRIGISKALSGNKIGDIAEAVENTVKSHDLEVVREYVGHGIGKQLHEEPSVPNYRMPTKGPTLRSGMVIAIEPMVVAGNWKTTALDDEWTVVTADGALSSHFEHTVAITEDGPEILTLRKYEQG